MPGNHERARSTALSGTAQGRVFARPEEKLVLVTGIGGFIARHLALELPTQGYRARGELRQMGQACRSWTTTITESDRTDTETRPWTPRRT